MSEIAIAPYADGRFEVFFDDKLIYSKLKTGDFPDHAEIAEKAQAGQY